MGLYDNLPESMRPFHNLPATHTKTYEVAAPLKTHYRPATCAEVECGSHTRGWQSFIDESTALGQKQAYYIRKQSGRRFTEERLETGITSFTFVPGQTCFGAHQVALDKPRIFLVRDGDYRGNPRGTRPRVHANGLDWVDDFATHQQAIADAVERG